MPCSYHYGYYRVDILLDKWMLAKITTLQCVHVYTHKHIYLCTHVPILPFTTCLSSRSPQSMGGSLLLLSVVQLRNTHIHRALRAELEYESASALLLALFSLLYFFSVGHHSESQDQIWSVSKYGEQMRYSEMGRANHILMLLREIGSFPLLPTHYTF